MARSPVINRTPWQLPKGSNFGEHFLRVRVPIERETLEFQGEKVSKVRTSCDREGEGQRVAETGRWTSTLHSKLVSFSLFISFIVLI